MARPGQVITRPELAVLMAASKMYLTQQIQDQSACTEGRMLRLLFAGLLSRSGQRNSIQEYLSGHPLAHEIKATLVSNKIINQAGCGFLSLDIDSENSNILDHVTCYLTFDRVLDGDALRQAIYALDNKIAADKQYQLLMQLENTLIGFCRWALLHGREIRPDASTINSYSLYLKDYEHYFKRDCIEADQFNEQLAQYRQDGIPDKLAQSMVFISSLNDFPLIVLLTNETGQDFVTTLKLFNEIYPLFGSA